LDFSFGSDPGTLRIVGFVTAFDFALTLLLLVLVLLMRCALLRRRRRRTRLLTVWQPILVKAVENPTSDVPRLARRDLPEFLLLWNHLHESLLDESKNNLNQIANALSIGSSALRMLHRRNLRRRLVAIATLGQLGERAAWDELLSITERGKARVSLAAARALVMIDAPKAVPQLIPLLLTRTDWPPSRVAAMLQVAGAEAISSPIADAAIKSAREEKLDGKPKAGVNIPARMVRYLELAYNESALPASRTIARLSSDPEVLAACLRLLESAEDLPIIRENIGHEDWRVRVQAASALGRIGEDEDEQRLVPLLSDTEWWVRYRGAQALSRLPSIDQARLKTIQAGQADPFARDILTQVMAEVELR